MTLQNALGDIALDTSVQQVKTAVEAVTATINDGIPVTGAFYPATQPVSIAASVAVTGPLTDSQLRAAAVPVSGTFYPPTQPVSIAADVSVTGPLTDAQLRAVAVPVSGTFYPPTQPVSIAASVSVTGPLTDSQLRAAAVPVSASSLPLPTGAATQTTLASVDSRLAGILNVDTGIDQPLTNAELRAGAVPVSASSLPLPTGAATDGLQTEIRNLNDTLLILLSAILEKMPRVTGNDQMVVSIESGAVGITGNQTLSTLSTLTNLQQIGGQDGTTLARAQIMSGATYIYNNIKVT